MRITKIDDKTGKIMVSEEERLLSKKGILDYEEKEYIIRKLKERLFAFEEAEDNGDIFHLPCKIGDEIVFMDYKASFGIRCNYPLFVTGFSLGTIIDNGGLSPLNPQNKIVVHYKSKDGETEGTFLAEDVGTAVIIKAKEK